MQLTWESGGKYDITLYGIQATKRPDKKRDCKGALGLRLVSMKIGEPTGLNGTLTRYYRRQQKVVK